MLDELSYEVKILIGIVVIIIVIFMCRLYNQSYSLKLEDTTHLKDTYSQIGQDINIIDYFKQKENGYFIDIGATNGIDINNTYLLEKKYGWNGICIEPQRSYWSDLNKNRNCHTDNSLLYSTKGKVLDFSEAEELGGITQHIDAHDQAKSANQIKLITDTLNNILDKYNAPKEIDYMSLDTEGSELEILKGLDMDKYKIKYINIEHNYIEPRRSEIKRYLESKGYKYYRENQWDDDYILDNITGIIQIGAHTGEEAEHHYNSVGENMVWIEAQPDKYEILKHNVSQYGQKAIQSLLWNESGIMKDFYVTNNSVSSSILEPFKHKDIHGDKVKVKHKYKLNTITYSDLINKYPELKNPVYNFLILDCQGAEYEVLQGIGKYNIQQFDKLEVEISNFEGYRHQKQQPEITKLLNEWGYKCIENCENNDEHGISIYIKK